MVIFIAVARPYWANVLVPVAPVPVWYIVSEVIAIVQDPEFMLINVTAVPSGKATELFAGMVKAPALVM